MVKSFKRESNESKSILAFPSKNLGLTSADFCLLCAKSSKSSAHSLKDLKKCVNKSSTLSPKILLKYYNLQMLIV